jgi:signal recognition particle GTPase
MPMMSGMPMSGIMGIRLISTSDGGVVVMVANKLYKYDKKLDLVKEAEVPIDLENMKNMMMNMQKMGMMGGMMGSGMMGGMKGSESTESQK